jgi:A/G-specific adenine glycosylase
MRGPKRSKIAGNVMLNRHNLTIPFAPGNFQNALLGWYDASQRVLPWRAKPGTKPDPYRVWLSEIMLQQTTVKAVIPYFEAFLARWPDARALGAASRDEILAAWAGLGYYSRARNLHACAKKLAQEDFPADEAGLRQLPGVGAYTAAAIAAIAFGQPAAAVDGNAERVLSRLFALPAPLPAAKPQVRALAMRLVSRERPGDYAQAMMDLGATICTPRSPSCPLCPVSTFCAALPRGEQERFPIKAPKAPRPIRRGDAFVVLREIEGSPHILLRRRPENGLLGGMTEVPCTQWSADAERSQPMSLQPSSRRGSSRSNWMQAETVQHTFTHFRLEMRVFAARYALVENEAHSFGGEWAALSSLPQHALPSVMKKAAASGLQTLGIAMPNYQTSNERSHG